MNRAALPVVLVGGLALSGCAATPQSEPPGLSLQAPSPSRALHA